MTKIHNSIIQAALLAASNLRSTADRLQQAADRQDFEALAEISMSMSGWNLGMIRGAALVIARQEAESLEYRPVPMSDVDADAHGGRYLEPFDRGKR